MAADRKIPAPGVNPETEPFWAAAREGRFLIKGCTNCGRNHWYPRAVCPHCQFRPSAEQLELIPAANRLHKLDDDLYLLLEDGNEFFVLFNYFFFSLKS